MDLGVIDHVESIDKSRSDWKIKVRVTRMWPTVAAETGTNKGCNLILLDDDNAHVHAFAYADVWNNIGTDVVQGRVYIVQNFSVRDSTGNLKPVSSRYTIRLQSTTTFLACDEDNMIANHKFEFLDLGDLFKEASRLEANEIPEYAIDIIGVVEDFENCKTISTRFGDREITRFRLCDTSNRHRVAIWGELAKTVQNDYSKELERPVIAIITSTKLSTFKNSVQITTLPSSKVLFNLDDDFVTEMRQRLQEEGYGSRIAAVEMNYALGVVLPYEKINFDDLTLNPLDNLKSKLFCTFSVTKIEEGGSWYINSCSICHAEVQKIENIFNCVSCNRNIPLSDKRYRVEVTAQDHTQQRKLYLMDRVVKKITGISASRLLKANSTEPNNGEGIPILLSNLVGQEFTVTIEIVKGDEDNVFSVEAVDIYDQTLTTAAPSESPPPPEYSASDFPSINLTDSFEEIDYGKTPGSAHSVNKKIKMEK